MSDIEVYVNNVIDMYQSIRKLYRLAFDEETKGKLVDEVIRGVFEVVLPDSKYQHSDVSRLMNIAFDKEYIQKLDNFELDELGYDSKNIKEAVESKITDLEIKLEEPDSYE